MIKHLLMVEKVILKNMMMKKNAILGSKNNKYLTILFTNEYQKLLYSDILKKINRKINRNYVKIKFLVNIHSLIPVVRYQRVYLNTCWYDQFYNGIHIKDTVR